MTCEAQKGVGGEVPFFVLSPYFPKGFLENCVNCSVPMFTRLGWHGKKIILHLLGTELGPLAWQASAQTTTPPDWHTDNLIWLLIYDSLYMASCYISLQDAMFTCCSMSSWNVGGFLTSLSVDLNASPMSDMSSSAWNKNAHGERHLAT